MYRNYKITPVTNFSGGLVTKVKELNGMPANASPDCMDVYSDIDGSLRKRYGAKRLNSIQVGGSTTRCNGLFDFEGTLIAGLGNTYYRTEELSGVMYPLVTGMKDDIIQCEDYEGNLIICNWGYDFAKVLSKSSSLVRYTKLLIHADGAQGSTDFEDATGHIITNHNSVTVDTAQKKFGSGSALFDGATNWLSIAYSYTIPNPPDGYTMLLSHFNGTNGDVTYTAETGQTISFLNSAQLSNVQIKFSSTSLLLASATSDYVTIPDNASWDFGTGDFTIDCWIYASSWSTNTLMMRGDAVSDATNSFRIEYGGGKIYAQVSIGGSNILVGNNNSVSTGAWHHIALVRATTTLTLYVDGVPQATTGNIGTSAVNNPSNYVAIGRAGSSNSNYYNGYIDEVRISKGIARWTANFSANLPTEYAVSSTVATTDFDILAGDYTIDQWVRFNNLPTNGNKMVIASQYKTAVSYWELSILNTTGTYSIQFLFYNGSAKTVTVNSTGLSTNTWYHIAMCKQGTSYYFFQNGVLQGTKQTNASSVLAVSADAAIGESNSASFFDGWIDEIRFSQGIARWTAGFSVPTSPYDLSSSVESIPFNLSTTSMAGVGKHPKVYKNHLLISGAPGYPYSFLYSKIGTYNDFDNGGVWPINTFDGDILSGWGELWGRAYAFKRWSIHQLTFRGGIPYWQVSQITWGIGTRSPMTIKNVTTPNGTQMLIFLGSDRKLYQFDGYTATAISKNIEENNSVSPIAMDTLNQGGLEYAHAVVDPINHWYILFVANGGSADITHALVYNYFTGTYNFQSASQFSGGAYWPFSNQTYRASCAALDPNGRKWIITGGYSGYIYRWNYGNADDATAISAYHTTPRLLMMKDSAVETPEVVVSMRTRSSDSLNFQHREDYRMPWSADYLMAQCNPSDIGAEYYLGVNSVLGTMTLGAFKPVREHIYGLDTMSEYIQFKISDAGLVTDPWVVYAYAFKGVGVSQIKMEA